MDPRLERLHGILRDMGSVLVAFSGGTDSALVLKAAHDVLGDRAVALTAVSPSLAPLEKLKAVELARQIGAQHVLVESKELDNPGYARNHENRCYYCKTELFTLAEPERTRLGLAYVVSGTNLDDLGDYRPGLEAAREHCVREPLVEAGLRKTDVRSVSCTLGLPTWDKPAAACLSSRIPYGTAVTAERLGQVARFEAELIALGFMQLRVRYHGELARLELGGDEIHGAFEHRQAIVDAGKRCGFVFVTLDLQGYRTGSFNELLQIRTRRTDG